MAALNANYSGAASEGKLDLDNASQAALAQLLQQNDPEHLAATGGAPQRYTQQAAAILNHRDHDLGGMFSSLDQLNGVADPAVATQLKQGAYLSGFHVFGAEIIGPQVGALLRKQALLGRALLPVGYAGLFMVPLRADLRGGRGGRSVP